MSTAPTNPECKQGKHDNCTEEAWDDALDCLTDCLCMCHDENNGESGQCGESSTVTRFGTDETRIEADQ